MENSFHSIKVAIVGSRTFNDYSTMCSVLNKIRTEHKYIYALIISGGASGADTLGYKYSLENNIKSRIFQADWKRDGKSAGFKRNTYIIDACDICICFWDGQSHGTKHDIDLCVEKGKPCYVYNYIRSDLTYMENVKKIKKSVEQVEKEIENFLDSRLYSDKNIFINHYRTYSEEEKNKGNDVMVTSTDHVLNDATIMEHVMYSYANNDLKVYSFSLLYTDRHKQLKDGWLLDKEKKNEYILIGWIPKADIPFDEKTKKFDYKCLSKDNIRIFKWFLISKRSIMNYLSRIGFTESMIRKQIQVILERGYVKTQNYWNGIAFRYFSNNEKKVININITNYIIEQIAYKFGTITQ